MRAQSSIRKSRASFGGDSENAQMFVMVANYRGTIVAIKTIQKPRIDVNRALLQEMNIVSWFTQVIEASDMEIS